MLTELPQIREWVDFAFRQNGVPELADRTTLEWNTRLTRRVGDALYHRGTGKGRIRLSVRLWSLVTEEQRRETAIHEACHIVVGYQSRYATEHGVEWQRAMVRCGVHPNRTLRVDRTGLDRKQREFTLVGCSLEKKCHLSVRLFNRWKKGEVFHCYRCGLVIDGSAVIEPVKASPDRP